MASFYKRGKTYTVVYRLKGHSRQYIFGIKSAGLAKKAKEKKDLEEELARADLFRPDPYADRLTAAAAKPIAEHITDFEKDILARGKNAQHAQQQAAHCRRIFKIARISDTRQIACEPLQRALSRLLGPKCGPRTCNAARQAAIQFERYLKRTKKVAHCVLHDLQRFNEKEDVRRKRRPLTQEEVDWLLATTESKKDAVSRRCGIPPADRATLYAGGIGTGFRRRALLSLEKRSFRLDGKRPLVRLAAKYNKNGKDRDQPIPGDLAERLRLWLSSKPDSGRVWQPSEHADLALRFRRDLEAARAAWIAAADNDIERKRRQSSDTLKYVFHDGVQNVFADFHGLRHTGITFVVRKSGIRVGQEWADHSTPVLTARYAEVNEADLTAAIEGLPSVSQRSASVATTAPTVRSH